jgi:hypothetical protein
MERRCKRWLLGRSAASSPTTAREAPLGGAVSAATGSAPGENREGRQATGRRFEVRGSAAGESRDWKAGLRAALVRCGRIARGLLAAWVGGVGCTGAGADAWRK